MTRSLYGWKPPSAATDYLNDKDQREAIQRAAARSNGRTQAGRDWIAAYLANRPTKFNWSGTLPVTITKETNDEESKKAASEVREDVGDAPGEGGGGAGAEVRPAQTAGDRPGSILEGCGGPDAADFETPF